MTPNKGSLWNTSRRSNERLTRKEEEMIRRIPGQIVECTAAGGRSVVAHKLAENSENVVEPEAPTESPVAEPEKEESE
jgi:hypothetical protein